MLLRMLIWNPDVMKEKERFFPQNIWGHDDQIGINVGQIEEHRKERVDILGFLVFSCLLRAVNEP